MSDQHKHRRKDHEMCIRMFPQVRHQSRKQLVWHGVAVYYLRSIDLRGARHPTSDWLLPGTRDMCL